MSRLLGIDISHWQNQIDWTLAAQHISFVFIKSSEASTVDPSFQTHWQNACKTGLLHGAYHFYRPILTGKYQATVMAGLLAGQLGDLPNVLDLEDKGYAGGKAVANSARSFCETLAGLTNHPVMIYTSASFLFQLRMEGADLRWMAVYPLWQAGYPWERRKDFVQNFPNYQSQALDPKTRFPFEPYPYTAQAAIWQWSGHGRVPGIAGDVDVNVIEEGILNSLKG
ncbi:MAG TPA: glycoside hydrolase family 25 protein [Longilinea sp.]|nr:glycoside hydrolase family 25 protein [Longilinea sp.]